MRVTLKGPEFFFGAQNGAGKTLLPEDGVKPGELFPTAISQHDRLPHT